MVATRLACTAAVALSFAVGGTLVLVAGALVLVAVAGTDVLVAVGGALVLVGGTLVLVAVGGIGVLVDVDVAVGVAVGGSAITKATSALPVSPPSLVASTDKM